MLQLMFASLVKSMLSSTFFLDLSVLVVVMIR